MNNRAAYLVCVLFATLGAIVFLGFATIAALEGKIKVALVCSAAGAGTAYLCLQFVRAQKEVRKRYLISGDQLISADDPKVAPLRLSHVASVVSDAHAGFISLRGVDDEELRRIHIDNPIVDELRAYSEKPKNG